MYLNFLHTTTGKKSASQYASVNSFQSLFSRLYLNVGEHLKLTFSRLMSTIVVVPHR